MGVILHDRHLSPTYPTAYKHDTTIREDHAVVAKLT